MTIIQVFIQYIENKFVLKTGLMYLILHVVYTDECYKTIVLQQLQMERMILKNNKK